MTKRKSPDKLTKMLESMALFVQLWDEPLDFSPEARRRAKFRLN